MVKKIDLLFIIVLIISGSISLYALSQLHNVEDSCNAKWIKYLTERGLYYENQDIYNYTDWRSQEDTEQN